MTENGQDQDQQFRHFSELVTDQGGIRGMNMNYTISDLFYWLYLEGELKKPYNIMYKDTNCQGFAQRVFDKFAANKYFQV
jgi:hypothetical protein